MPMTTFCKRMRTQRETIGNFVGRPRVGCALRLLAVFAMTAAAVPGAAQPATAAPTPTPTPAGSGSALPSLQDGLQLHERMLPADSPDAVQPATASPAAPGYSTTSTATYGVDVASYQHPYGASIDWRSVAGSGQAFAIVKATEAGYTNPYLRGDVDGAHAAGLTVGTYAYARPQYSAVAQADALAASTGPLPSPSLPPVLDLEDSGGLSPTELIAWTHAFLNRLQAVTGILPMIYSGPYFWSTAMAGDTSFTDYPLWEAHYTTASAPQPMGGWSTYRLWQFTDRATVPGIQGLVDQSRFNGSRDQLTVVNAIDAKHAALGGDAGLLGPATTAEMDTTGGRVRFYRGGAIYWSASTGAFEMHGALLSQYQLLGGSASPLGLPTSDEQAVPGGRANTLQGGGLYWSPSTGAKSVYGAIFGRYQALGGPGGLLGLPTAEETNAVGGRMSAFTGGDVFWSVATAAHELHGDILATDRRLASLGLNLGLPVTDETGTPDGVGRYNQFSGNGSIYWTPSTGAHEVHGAIRDEWAATGWEAGLGYPTTDETGTSDSIGRYNQFSNAASIYWTSGTGAHAVYGAIRALWAQRGSERSRQGYPVSKEYDVPTGRRSDFQTGYITWDRATGVTTASP